MAEKYWYRFYTQACPVCGRENVYPKERLFTPKPESWNERHLYADIYDHCNS